MAKKYRVKYAFGTPAVYSALKEAGKIDEYTVYFIADESSEFGTFYKGLTRVGTAKAEDLIFHKDETFTLAEPSEPGDSGLTVEIHAGDSLVKVINDIYKWVFDGVSEDGKLEETLTDVFAKKFYFKEEIDNNFYTKDDADVTFVTPSDLEELEGAIGELLDVFKGPDGKVDPDVINTIVEAAQGIQEALKDYYTKAEIDAKYYTKTEIDNNLYTKEDIDKILISKDKNIVKTYDSSANFPNPALEPSDPNAPKESVFYVDDEDNTVYRWGWNEEGTAREYVEISGSGSGSGGEVKLETGIYVKGGKTTISIAKDAPLTIEYVFSSANTMTRYNKKTGEFEKVQQQTGSVGSARYLLDGVQFDSGTIVQSNYNESDETKNTYNTFVVPASRFTASSHELKIIAADAAGNSATETVAINIVSANITSSYVVTPTNLQNNINIPVTVTSTSTAELFYSIDGETAIKVQDVPVGSPVITVSISPEGRSHGYHTIKIWATVYIEESATTISTKVLSYDVIWYDPANTTPIVTTAFSIEKNAEGKYETTQYEYATLTYQVYPASTVDLIVRDVETGVANIINTLNVDTITKSWTYTFDTMGEYELYVNVHYDKGVLSSEKYLVTVKKSDVSMDATPGSVLYFTAKNRSNNEADPAHWHSEIGDVDAILDNFLWNDNSGWHSEGATTSLRVAAGAKCTIPYQPFGGTDKRETGQVFEIDFSTSNLTNSTAEVARCYSDEDKSGIIITATGAYFSSTEFSQSETGDARIHVPFKENERVRLSFVITPWLSDEEGHSEDSPEAIVNVWDGTSYNAVNSISSGWWRFVKVYINGICVSIHNYENGFHQSKNPSSIIIGSDLATIDIYSIRMYDTVLYDRSIVNNYIADTQDPVKKLELFKRNNILNEAGTDVEPSSLRRLMPCLFVTCQTDATVSGIVNNEHILPTNKADKRGVSVYFDCDGLDDDARKYYNFCHTFVAFNVQWAVQGTSSQYYPRRNWKATFKTEKKFNEDYVATSNGSKPTYILVDVPWEESIKDGRDARTTYVNKYKDNYDNKYQLKDFSTVSDEDRTVDEISSIPAKKFCMKADFAESSGTHNTGFAKYVDTIFKSLGYEYLTPPQKAQYNKNNRMTDVTFRTSVDGYPIAMFWRPTFNDDWEFYGKFNFNLDKGAESNFGFVDMSDGGITKTDLNPMTGQPFVEFDEDYYDAASQEDRIAYDDPVECWEFTNNSTDLCKFKNVTPTSFTEKSKDADGNTEVPAWLGSFEVRHPDNDNLIENDYGTGLKKPIHWAAFSEWVSSTDRTGRHNYDEKLPVPTTWTGTYEEFIAGSSAKESFGHYEGRLEQMREDKETEFDYNIRYILEPVAVDPGDGTISPDLSYDLYGHIVHWNSTTSKWYDKEKTLDTWVDDGLYVEEDTAVDTSKAYWMSKTDDPNYKKVYSYNDAAKTWDNIATIEQYALDKPVTYNTITYAYDTAEYRYAKFKAELPLHMNVPMTTAYFVLTEFFACVDQRAKNMMFASWGYEPGADKVKPASAFADETAADAAGYKPVYKYEINTAAPTALYAASESGIILGASEKTVVINEIDPNAKKMEFYNASDSIISLNGYVLKGTDEEGVARDDWSFPETAVIEPKGFYVITFKSADAANGPSYGLSGKKAWTFNLFDNNGNEIDTITNNLYTDNITGFAGSWGRETDGGDTWVEFSTPTIGSANKAGEAPETPVIPTTELFSYASYNTEITGFSGLCFNADKSGLFGVGDDGNLYTIDFEGNATNMNISAVEGEDFEGLTIDANGDLFAINERTGKVWKIAGPNYNTAVEAFTVTPVATVTNQGYEGITAYNDGFIVGNQSQPAALYTVTSAGGDPVLITNIECTSEVADVVYDGTNIWVLDSKEGSLAKLTVAGELVEKFSMPFINVSENGPEALAIDGNIAYIGCDNTGNKELYKVSLTNDPFDVSVVFNEFDPEFKVFVLYNATSETINLNGYSIIKENDEMTKFTFGDVNIDAHGYLVVPFKSDGIEGPTFGCSADKGFEYKLFNAAGAVIDRVDNLTEKTVIPDGMTYGRVIDGGDTFVLFRNHGTLGSSNANGIINAGIFINEIDTTGNDIGKRFELYNANDTVYDLTGHQFIKDGSAWTVVDTAVGEGLGLPSKIIPAHGYLVVQCNNNKAADVVETGAPVKDKTKWPDFGLSGSKGFILEIKNANGSYIDRVNNLITAINPNAVVIPANKTWGRATDGDEHNFAIFDTPNLGSANVNGTPYTATITEDPTAKKLYINEIDCTNDKIEIYNPNAEVIDLTGYVLSKDGDTSSMWVIPTGYSVPANGFTVLSCKEWNSEIGAIFGLSTDKGFYLTLADAAGRVLDIIDNRLDSSNYISVQKDHTLGRKTDGGDEWVEYSMGSIGTTNANGIIYVPATVDPGTPITDHVVINEVAYRKIELYNPTASSVNIGGLWLVKTPQDPGYNENIATEGRSDAWQIPAGTNIPAGGFVAYETQNSAVPGPQFGLSFKSGKAFDLYLMKDIGAMATAVGAQTIDPAKVIDHIDNYTNPVVDANNTISIGRVKDGYTGLCKFAVPTIGSTNNNSTPIPIEGGDTPGGETGTVKTVLYWVPKDAEYIYYPIFYDNDTILSLDNTGHIKFDPNVESTDRVGTGYAYNGTESVLWLNFKDAYDAEIRATYANMRTRGGLTYANCIKYFNESQSDQWPENVYNIDGKFKYVVPATKGYVDYSTQDPTTGKYGVTVRNATYLYECQGPREEHRKWWLNNRFTYMDSRYFSSNYAEDYATIRLYTPSKYEGVTPSSTFALTPYADMYLRVMFGQIVSTLRAEKNKTYNLVPSDPGLRFNDTETIIYGASNILSFGDMSNKYAGSVSIDKASKITNLLLGADEPYYNENTTGAGITIGAGNSTLKNIDVRGCTKLNRIMGLNQITSIEKIYAQRTGITSFDFSTNGINLNEIHYPNTIADIKLVNAKNIAYENIDIPTFTNIKTLWIENCTKLVQDSWRLVNSILNTNNNTLAAVRIVNFNWTINTKTAFETWTKLLKLMGIAASGIQSYDRPYLSGTVNIGGDIKVSRGYKAGIEARFADYGGLKLNIPNANIVDMEGITINYPDTVTFLNNVATIVPGTEYKFNVSYLPDEYVLDSEKGVKWEISGNAGADVSKISITEQTSEYIILKYIGSTDGSSTYKLRAISKVDSSISGNLTLNPSATLTRIAITDLNGNEISGLETINISENETRNYYVKFLPAGTTDDQILTPRIVGDDCLNVSYDATTKQLTITGKDVAATSTADVVIESSTVPNKTASLKFSVKNIVSRIIYLRNAAGNLIPGQGVVSWTDSKTGEERSENVAAPDGILNLRTDDIWGFERLVVDVDAAEGYTKPYNKPDPLICPKLAETADNDDIYNVSFYEPIVVTFTIMNGGRAIDDKPIRIRSNENSSLRNLDAAPYNNVVGGSKTGGADIKISLLPNTKHTITIEEVDATSTSLAVNPTYSPLQITVIAGTTNMTLVESLSRNYLTDVKDDTEIKMTVRTGSGAYTVARIFVATTGEISINWGDGTTVTKISGTNGYNVTGEPQAVYHVYSAYNEEYDITVSDNTALVNWFHVIPPTASYMTPCIGTSQSETGFNTTWTVNDIGAGLVAYQSIGAAKFDYTYGSVHVVNPTFRFENKTYSQLLSIGNIYKNSTEMTNANSLFENTTLQQISTIPLFKNCAKIRTFNATFKNTDIISIPANFFVTNNEASEFKETFANCTNLASINSAEDVSFFAEDMKYEIKTLVDMFKNCGNLSSEVPSFWKTYYGCSFCTFTKQNTFTGCYKASNIENVPTEWGGGAETYHDRENIIPLDYVSFYDSHIITKGNTYINTNIYPSAHYRYVFDVTLYGNRYEPFPLFSAGYTSDISKGEDSLVSAVDFIDNGWPDGKSLNRYNGYFLYRLGSDASASWSTANLPNGQPAEVFPEGYGGQAWIENINDWPGGERIIIDISYTKEGYVGVYPYGKEDIRREFSLDDWNIADTTWKANLPIRFLLPYNNLPIEYGTGPNDDKDTFGHAKYVTFRELKIYDDTESKTLIADLIPAYGKISEGSNEYSIFLYNKLGNNDIYLFTMPSDTLQYLHFYHK